MSLYSVKKALSYRFFRSFFWSATFFYVFSFIIFCPQNGQAAEVTLSWEANTESYLAGYKIYVGNSSRTYKYAVDAGNHTTHTLSIPSDGQTYYFTVTAYGTGENESDYSNELSWTSPYSNEVDTDEDGLSDAEEIDVYGTDPEDSDTDNDGFTDGYEVWNSFDPNNPDSRPQQDDVIIIIDNGDPGTTSDGSWKLSEGENPYDSNSLYSKNVGDTYTFEGLVNGSYQVSLWWTEWSNRFPDVPVEIYDGDTLLDVIKVNQQLNGGKWNVLGTYEFSGKASVVVVSEGDGSTSADAARLIPQY
jgi:hypothetical protein